VKINIKYLVILLITLSTYFLVSSYINYKNSKSLSVIVDNENMLNNLLLQIGRERDLTALYMGSKYKKFSEILKQQRIVVNKEIDVVSNIVDIYPSLDRLLSIRDRVDLNSSEFEDIFFSGYGGLYISPLQDRLDDIKTSISDNIILYLTSTLNQLNIAIEYSGLERGYISYFMEKQTSMDSVDIYKWDDIKIKSNSFTFPKFIDECLEDEIKLLYNSKSAKDTFLNLEDISMSILFDASKGIYKSNTSDWFTLQTQKITILSKIEFLILSKLNEDLNRFVLVKSVIFIISIILWIIIFISSVVYFYRQILKKREIPLVVDGEDRHFEDFIKLLTKIAYSSGVITNLEKDVINYSMNSFISIGKKQGMDSVELISLKEQLNSAYRGAKRDNEPFIKYASSLYDCSFDLKVQLLKQLVSMASIEGFSARKKMMIYEAVEAIGFDKLKIQKYINDIIGEDMESEIEEQTPYEILGCSLSDTDETIKKIYREQIKEFHPDYIQGKGLNDEIIKFAEQKLKKLNNAYAEIKKSRK